MITDLFLDMPWIDTALEILLALHGIALVIVNFTDTPKDNELLARLYRMIEFIAGIVRPNKVKQVGMVDNPPPDWPPWDKVNSNSA